MYRLKKIAYLRQLVPLFIVQLELFELLGCGRQIDDGISDKKKMLTAGQSTWAQILTAITHFSLTARRNAKNVLFQRVSTSVMRES